MIETTPQSGEASTATEEPAGHEHEGHSHGAATLNPDCTREVEIEIPADEVTRNFQAVTKRYKKMARIPGFRSGKVPESLIRGRFAEQIRQDVMEAVLPEHFRTAIAEQQLKPISQPQVTKIDLEDGKPLRFKAAFEVLPEFSIDGYQDVKVEKPSAELTDAEVDAELARIRDSRSTMEPVTEERPLADGDFAQISFTGSVQPAEGGSETSTAPQQPISGQDVMVQVGGPNTLDSFNAALRGATVGQQLKFEVSYPADFGERQLAGKRVAYDLEVKGIKKKIEPELNDEFAKELGPVREPGRLYAPIARTPGPRQAAAGANRDHQPAARCAGQRVLSFLFRSRWCSSRSTLGWIADCERSPPRACARKTCAISISIACARHSDPPLRLR